MAARLELLAGERQPGETARAVQACNEFLRQGPGRSLAGLLRKYGKMRENAAPTTSSDTLSSWSRRFDWPARAEAFDAESERMKTIARQIEFGRGLALDYARVRELKRLLNLLNKQLYAKDPDDPDGKLFNLWLKDYKRIGQGEDSETVQIERFNAPLIAELRGVLDDLAKETGGRRQKIDADVSGAVAVVTSDELAKARAEIQKWREQRFAGNEG